MKIQRFRLSDFLMDDEIFHIARVQINSRQDLSLHKHDYAEVFWVESGKGVHLINGKKKRLEPGDLIMIRPSDEHTFTALKGGVVLMNLAFGVETLEFFKNRYFNQVQSFFWTAGKLPYQVKLDMNIIHRISQRAKESMMFRNERLHLDSLLLFIFRMIQSNEKISMDLQMPEWLVKAIHRYNTPKHFGAGVAGFASLCNKNSNHVNRVVRKHLSKTVSDLVRDLRMSFASRQLIITNTPIKTISNECGYTNLGHFYQVFKSTYYQTPSQFRKMNQTIC